MTRKRIGGKEPYARVYASAHSHPRHLIAGLAAEGLWKRAMAYCADHLTDGFVPAEWLEGQGGKRPVKAGVDAGLFKRVERGYMVCDYLDHNPSREDVEVKRGTWNHKKALQRDRALIAAVRERDGDRCRYCGVEVNWSDKRGSTGGTYDHLVPRGENELENIVVACRACNVRKSDRPLAESGLDLIPVPNRSQNGMGADLASPRARADDSVTQLHSARAQT